MYFPSRFSVIIVFILSVISLDVFSANVTRGPYLQMNTHEAITIRWRTDVRSDSVVRYGTSLNNLRQSKRVSGNRREHEVRLTGLSSDQAYYYSIGSSTEVIGAGSSYRFSTAPTPGTASPTRIWLIGDSGTANSNAAAVYNAYLNHPGADNTDLWIMLGDNAYNDGTDNQYQNAVFNMYPELLRRTPLWSTLGNHDGYTADSASESGPYYDIFTLPRNAEAGGLASGTEAYYSFDYGNIHFICLDSYETNRSPTGAMMTWLENDIAATNQQWIIAFWHHPPYTKGSHNSDTERALIDMRENALPILEDFGVDLVLSGHSHSYERSYLIDSHYGSSSTFNASHLIDGGSGREDGSGAYQKSPRGSHTGTVYTVAGASGKISGGRLNHPAMFTSLNQLGSVVLDVNGNRLDAKHLRANGAVSDYYTLIKGVDTSAPILSNVTTPSATSVQLTFSEQLDRSSAQNISNYSISNGINILSARLDGQKVTLTTSALNQGLTYTLLVNNVEDINGNPISPNSAYTFEYQNIQTANFQNGLGGYTGTTDTYIASGVANNNYGSAREILADGDDGSNGELASLLRWDLSGLPIDSTIISADIILDVFNPSSGNYQFYTNTIAWNENSATWNSISPSNTRGAQVASIQPANTGTYTLRLNSAGIELVQSWLDGNNRGLVLMSANSNDGIDIRSSEYDQVTRRPRLRVTYSVASTNNNPPLARFDMRSDGLTARFTDTSTDSDGTIVNWSWLFGDGNATQQQNPIHSYLSPGNYNVTLTVTDNSGAQSNTTRTLNIGTSDDTSPPSIPQAISTDIAADSVTLTWPASSDNIGVASYTIRRDGVVVGNTSETRFTDEPLSSNSTYGYTIEAVDTSGNTSGQSTVIIVNTSNIAPVASFTHQSRGLQLSFTDTSTDSDGNITRRRWEFGDGNVSTQQNPTHTYAAAGTYLVQLTVGDNKDGSDTLAQNINVSHQSDPVTVVLQQGLNNYNGSEDTYVAEGRANSNYGRAPDILADGDDGSRDELISLLKWDTSDIPLGTTVTEAKITLQVHNRTDAAYNLWEMQSSWDERNATWANSAPESNRGARIGRFTASSTGNYTITLNRAGLALVQRWIDGLDNNGITIESSGTRNGLDMRSSEYSTRSQRPMLTIRYQ